MIIKPEQVLGKLQQLLNDIGMSKRLIVLYKSFGGDEMFLYNENLVPIIDDFTLYHSREIIYTNQTRTPNGNLEGEIKFDDSIILKGRPSVLNYLTLKTQLKEYTILSEYTLLNTPDIKVSRINSNMRPQIYAILE